MRAIPSVVSLAALCAAARPVAAQVSILPASSPTRGLEVPAGPIVGDADATALELNPGQIGLVQHATFTALVNRQHAAALRGPAGGGLFLALPVGNAALGGSVQSLLAPSLGGSYYKSQIGLALRNSSTFGIGLSWSHFFADRIAQLSDLDTFDAGLSLRPWRHLGFGLSVRDLNRPNVGGGRRLQRSYASELAWRPFGDHTLEVAGGATVGEERLGLGVQGRLNWRIRRGLHLAGQFVRTRADVFPNVVTDSRATLGVLLDWDHVGLALFGMGSKNAVVDPELPSSAPGGRERTAGISLAVRLSADRREPLSGSQYIERVELAKIKSDRDFLALLTHLRRMESDPDVAGFLFETDDLELGLARIDELRAVITSLNRKGKKTYAFFTTANTRAFFLASACSQIVMQRAGTLMLNGLHSTITFFKSALDRLGVEVDVVRIAEYKGALEPFMGTKLSDPVRENVEALLEHAFLRVVSGIVEGRNKLDQTKVRALIDRGEFTAEEAEEQHLVDLVKNRAELDTLDGLPVRDPSDAPEHRAAWALPRVAVLFIDGAIVDGESEAIPFADSEMAGARTIVAHLDHAREDSEVRAVVLRVNSPGGSLTASEEIARAVTRLREAGKPVVVSMGDVAASGGYYVSAPADVIYADALTTTGSIGIYTAHINLSGLAANLGLDFETLRRGERADRLSSHRPWDEEDREHAQAHLAQLYTLFLDTVVAGRKTHGLDRDAVDAVGRGRVFDGDRARELKLVDKDGGLLAALAEAARLAGIPVGKDGLPELLVYENVKDPLFKVQVAPASTSVSLMSWNQANKAGTLPQPFGHLVQQLGLPWPWLVTLARAQSGQALALLPFDIRLN